MSERRKPTAAELRHLEARLGYHPGDFNNGYAELSEFERNGEWFRVRYRDPERGVLVVVGIWELGLRPAQHRCSHPSQSTTTRATQRARDLTTGLTQREFAAIAGIDHRTLSKHIVEIPTGPAPVLPPGKIPARRLGNTRRIFLADLFGTNQHEGRAHDAVNAPMGSRHIPTSGSDEDWDWRGPLHKLREG